MSVGTAVQSRSTFSLWDILVELLPAVLAVALVVAAAIVHVTSRVQVVRLGYRLSTLDAQRAQLEHENAGLKLELATLRAPARLEAAARDQFSLAPPKAGTVLHVKE
jgi:cell division protein FtsL